MGQAPRRRLQLWTAVGSSWPPCHTGTHQSQRGPADSILRFSLVLTMAVPRKRLGDPKDARTALRELPVQHRGELPAVLSGVVFRLTVLDAVFDADASRPVTARLLAGGRAPAAGTLQQGVGAPLQGCPLQVAGRCVQPLFGFTKTAVMQGPCPHVRRSASASRRNSWKRNPHFAGHCETAVRAACGRRGGQLGPPLAPARRPRARLPGGGVSARCPLPVREASSSFHLFESCLFSRFCELSVSLARFPAGLFINTRLTNPL